MQGYVNTRSICSTVPGKKMAAALILLSTLLSGCGLLQKVGILSAPEDVPSAPVPLSEQPYTLNLSLSASSDLNPDTQSRPSPVQVRVFIAERESEIDSKSFEEMFDYAGNLIDPRPASTLTLRPGQTRTISLPANKSQTLIVVAAAYRDPYQTLWKAVSIIEPADTVTASATISADAVTISQNP
jgi:type VI secretion system VasD/TssJ family lipoprotein